MMLGAVGALLFSQSFWRVRESSPGGCLFGRPRKPLRRCLSLLLAGIFIHANRLPREKAMTK
jgi:hypothetical protein